MRNKPRIRFKGFTEDWEQRKLGAMCSLFTDGDWIESKDQSNEGIRLIQTGNIGVGKFIDKPENKKWISHSTFDNLRCKELLDGDILISRLPHPAGRACIVSTNNEKWITAVDCTIVRLLDRYSNKFILQSLCTYNYFHLIDSFLAGGTRQRVSRSNLSDINIMSPEKIEQDKIGLFFECIDNIITLHQRKLEKLKLAKKALLQKLFPKNGSKFPELRFKGFADAWEQRKLGQFTARVTRKNGGQSDLPLTISAQDGLVDQRKYFNRQVASRDMSNYYLIKKGEFAYNKSYSEGYPFGAVKRLDYYDIGALSTLYILFEITDKNISSDFIVSYYMTHLWYKEISKRAAEGARNHGLLNISTEDFFDSELNIPNSIEEQVKIGNFIKEFDKFITLHQRKLDKLQEVKKGLLQKMFV